MNRYVRKPYERHPAKPLGLEKEESVTDTSAGNDTDVNRIVERFARTGLMPENAQQPQYADVTRLQGDLAQMICDSRNALAELGQAKSKAKQSKQQEIQEKLKKLEQMEKDLETQKTDDPAAAEAE